MKQKHKKTKRRRRETFVLSPLHV